LEEEKEQEKKFWESTDRVIIIVVSVRISDSYRTRNTDIIALSIRSLNGLEQK